MFAVIKTGGKQYVVREGEEIKVETLDNEPGASVELQVLLVADDDGTEVAVGKPQVTDKTVLAQVMEHGRDEKKRVVKFKAKSRYRRHTSHRQPFTKIKIGKI